MLDTAIILCGGQGTRLRPVIGNTLPKCLAPVEGIPFVNFILEQLRQQRFSKVYFCTNGKMLQQLIRYGDSWYGMELWYWWSGIANGNGSDLRSMLIHKPDRYPEHLLIINGDTYCDTDFQQFENPNCILYHNDVSTGVRMLKKELILEMPEEVGDLDSYLLGRDDVEIIDGDYPFIDIGTPEGYAKAGDFLRQCGVIYGN